MASAESRIQDFIDLVKARKAKTKKRVKVTRGGKTFYRMQEVNVEEVVSPKTKVSHDLGVGDVVTLSSGKRGKAKLAAKEKAELPEHVKALGGKAVRNVSGEIGHVVAVEADSSYAGGGYVKVFSVETGKELKWPIKGLEVTKHLTEEQKFQEREAKGRRRFARELKRREGRAGIKQISAMSKVEKKAASAITQAEESPTPEKMEGVRSAMSEVEAERAKKKAKLEARGKAAPYHEEAYKLQQEAKRTGKSVTGKIGRLTIKMEPSGVSEVTKVSPEKKPKKAPKPPPQPKKKAASTAKKTKAVPKPKKEPKAGPSLEGAGNVSIQAGGLRVGHLVSFGHLGQKISGKVTKVAAEGGQVRITVGGGTYHLAPYRKVKVMKSDESTPIVGTKPDLVDFIKAHASASIKGWAKKMKREGGEHPFTWCANKVSSVGFSDDPNAFCAAVHLQAFGMTPLQRKKAKEAKTK